MTNFLVFVCSLCFNRERAEALTNTSPILSNNIKKVNMWINKYFMNKTIELNNHYYFDSSFLGHLLPYLSLIYEILFRLLSFLLKNKNQWTTYKGNQVFILGSNKFFSCPEILRDKNKPLIRVERIGKRLFVTADFYDRDDKLVAKLIRNKLVTNKNNIVELLITRRKIHLVNIYNEAVDIEAHKTGKVELNGIFYCSGRKIEATPTGMRIG